MELLQSFLIVTLAVLALPQHIQTYGLVLPLFGNALLEDAFSLGEFALLQQRLCQFYLGFKYWLPFLALLKVYFSLGVVLLTISQTAEFLLKKTVVGVLTGFIIAVFCQL